MRLSLLALGVCLPALGGVIRRKVKAVAARALVSAETADAGARGEGEFKLNAVSLWGGAPCLL